MHLPSGNGCICIRGYRDPLSRCHPAEPPVLKIPCDQCAGDDPGHSDRSRNLTTTISGSTIAYADGLFPMKNIPVLKLSETEENDCWLGKSEGLKEKILWFLKQSDSSKIVLAVNGKKNPGYTELKTFAAALGDGMHATIPTGEPLLLLSGRTWQRRWDSFCDRGFKRKKYCGDRRDPRGGQQLRGFRKAGDERSCHPGSCKDIIIWVKGGEEKEHGIPYDTFRTTLYL